jgi:protein-S-isoprenylcysteine O-methyltransferase Ste14
VGVALAEYFLRPHPTNWAWFGAGLAAGLSSFALRGWAAAHLRAYWSMHIEVRKDHPLVQEGPYAWVRHPIYTAAALELVGAILILQSWWSFLALALFFVPAVTVRILLEERAMIAHFGDTYRTYMTNTPALVRFLPPGRNRAP